MVVPPYNPGFSETPPFAWIFGVQWPSYRLVLFLMAQHGEVQFAIQFAGPKTYYTLGELNQLEAAGQKIQIPIFGVQILVPTDTLSRNGFYPRTTPFGNDVTITGDLLVDAGPTGFPD